MNEKQLHAKNGMLILILSVLLWLTSFASIIVGAIMLDSGEGLGGIFLGIGILWAVVGWIPLCGLKVLKPQEALVLTLFGKYIGTLKGEGFYFVHPFCSAVNPAAKRKKKKT